MDAKQETGQSEISDVGDSADAMYARLLSLDVFIEYLDWSEYPPSSPAQHPPHSAEGEENGR